MTDIDQAKRAARERVWRRLIVGGGAPADSYGKIPGFYGAEATAELLAGLDDWRQAATIKANSGWAQLPVCVRVLKDGLALGRSSA